MEKSFYAKSVMILMKINNASPTMLLVLLAFGIIIIVSINSCTKTNTVTQVKDSTVVDTVRDTIGRGFIRFVSMLPPSAGADITIFNADSVTQFTTVSSNILGSYFPVMPDTSMTLFAYIPSLGGFQFMPLPKPGETMNTYALFIVGGAFDVVRSIDVEKFTPPPADSCYFRLINGDESAPGPFFVDIDTVGHSIFYTNSLAQSIPFPGISYYARIPAGEHTFYLRADEPTNPDTVISSRPLFQCAGGQYYTAEVDSSGILSVQPER
jgi:hypothetical protein